MNRKQKGFSLAELLIALLVISIVLSAAIPAITKRAGQQRELVWRWTEENNAATYTATGATQSVLIGLDVMPNLEKSKLFLDAASLNCDASAYCGTGTDRDNLTGEHPTYTADETRTKAEDQQIVKISDYGDKLTLLKPRIDETSSNFVNSHISFYTKGHLSNDPIEYAGRLTMDTGNIALGIGTLQSLIKKGQTWSSTAALTGDNTAIGHYALFRDTIGKRNTAIGKRTLSYNETGSYNSALGFGSLYWLDRHDEAKNEITDQTGIYTTQADRYLAPNGTTNNASLLMEYEIASENTASGAEALYALKRGSYNTALGSRSLANIIRGSYNTAVGREALRSMSDYSSDTKPLLGDNFNAALGARAIHGLTYGAGNTAVGTGACANLSHGHNNICIGYNANGSLLGYYVQPTDGTIGSLDHDGLFIGGGLWTAPLIMGHTEDSETRYYKNLYTTAKKGVQNYNKELIVNAEDFIVRNAQGNIQQNLLTFHTKNVDPKSTVTPTNSDSYYTQFLSNESSLTLQLYNKYKSTDGAKLYIGTNPQGLTTHPSGNNVYINAEAVVSAASPAYRNILLYGREATGNATGAQLSIIPYGTSTDTGKFIEVKTQTGNSIKFNDKVTIKRHNDAPTVNIDESGFIVGNDSYAKKIYIASSSTDSDINFNSFQYTGTGSTITGSLKGILSRISSDVDGLKTTINNYHSDARLKNIKGDNKAGLKEINQLQVKDYTFKKDEKKTPHVGVIAQQLMKVFPNAVTKDKDGYYVIRTEDIFYALVNSVKELCAQIQELTAKITGLDARLKALEEENKLLKEKNAAFEKRFEALEKRQSALEAK